MTGRSANYTSKRRFGAMTLVGGLLVLSAVLRLAIGAGAAMAREDTPKHDAPATSAADASLEAGRSALTTDDIQPILHALGQRESRLKTREEAVAVRMKALEVAEREIDRKLQELQQSEERLRQTLALAQTAAEDDLTRLTDVYASMKPKQAAALFEEMDPEFAAGFLGRMRPNSAATIMAGLSPGAAYSISVILAGRNANVPTE